jgi:uncharacterized protein (TIRG00374 family)
MNITRIVMIALAVFVFAYIGYTTNWNETFRALKQANPMYITIGALIMIFAHFLRAYRWNILTKTNGYPIHLRRAFYSVMTGYLVNSATSRGGEVVRCAITAKSEKAPVEMLVGTVITERIIDLFTLILMAIIGLIIQFNELFGFFQEFILTPIIGNLKSPTFWAILLIISIFATFTLNYYRKTKAKTSPKEGIIQKFISGMTGIFKLKNPSIFILSSLGIWFSYWFAMYFQLQALDITEHLTLAASLAVVLFSALGIIVPMPGGAGVWYFIAWGLTTVYHFDSTNANTFGVFTVAFSNILQIVLGGISYGLLILEMQRIEKKSSTNHQ